MGFLFSSFDLWWKKPKVSVIPFDFWVSLWLSLPLAEGKMLSEDLQAVVGPRYSETEETRINNVRMEYLRNNPAVGISPDWHTHWTVNQYQWHIFARYGKHCKPWICAQMSGITMRAWSESCFIFLPSWFHCSLSHNTDHYREEIFFKELCQRTVRTVRTSSVSCEPSRPCLTTWLLNVGRKWLSELVLCLALMYNAADCHQQKCTQARKP